MNEEIKRQVYGEIEEQITLIQIIKDKLDESLGNYSDELLIAIHEWVNKWLMSRSISLERDKSRFSPSDSRKKLIILSDGEKKTIDVKEQLKNDGWRFDRDRKAWTKEMTVEEWYKIKDVDPYRSLFAKWEDL